MKVELLLKSLMSYTLSNYIFKFTDEPCPPLVTSQSDDILFRLPQDSNDNSPKFMLECTSTYKTFPAPE